MKRSETSVTDDRQIAFAHILRGVAALIVLVDHLGYNFWVVPAALAPMLGAPAIAPKPNLFTIVVDRFFPPSFLGHFGVALFFLISGFVIPFSLLNRTRLQFGAARVLRLWPTYATGLSVTALFVVACATWFGQPRPFSWSTYFYQLLFVRDLMWIPSIDGIAWTLEIEAKFYLLMALLAPVLRRGRVLPIVLVTGFLACFGAGASRLPGWVVSYQLSYRPLYGLTLSAQMISYMLIGTVFNFFYRNLISRRTACATIAFLFAMLVVQWLLGPIRMLSDGGIKTYAAALAFFAVTYLARERIRRTPAILAWLANISYPLYVVHGVAGYALMRVMLDLGFGVAECMGTASAFAFLTAWILHVLVEAPTQALGKRISRRLATRSRPSDR